jgi:hypothetical protein
MLKARMAFASSLRDGIDTSPLSNQIKCLLINKTLKPHLQPTSKADFIKTVKKPNNLPRYAINPPIERG